MAILNRYYERGNQPFIYLYSDASPKAAYPDDRSLFFSAKPTTITLSDDNTILLLLRGGEAFSEVGYSREPYLFSNPNA